MTITAELAVRSMYGRMDLGFLFYFYGMYAHVDGDEAHE
jgi:hypothetical protein